MEELFGFLFSAGVVISLIVAVANWGRSAGMKWGQVLLLGVVFSPLIAAGIVLVYTVTKKIKSAFLE